MPRKPKRFWTQVKLNQQSWCNETNPFWSWFHKQRIKLKSLFANNPTICRHMLSFIIFAFYGQRVNKKKPRSDSSTRCLTSFIVRCSFGTEIELDGAYGWWWSGMHNLWVIKNFTGDIRKLVFGGFTGYSDSDI